jgi:hypothetical protein
VAGPGRQPACQRARRARINPVERTSSVVLTSVPRRRLLPDRTTMNHERVVARVRTNSGPLGESVHGERSPIGRSTARSWNNQETGRRRPDSARRGPSPSGCDWTNRTADRVRRCGERCTADCTPLGPNTRETHGRRQSGETKTRNIC